MSQYVILQHDSPRGLHFDFMLEMDGVLKTWSIPMLPAVGREICAESLPDHRLAYLDYEGPISDARGSVARWDRGTFEIENQSELELALRLSGEKLTGSLILRQSPAEPKSWSILFAT